MTSFSFSFNLKLVKGIFNFFVLVFFLFSFFVCLFYWIFYLFTFQMLSPFPTPLPQTLPIPLPPPPASMGVCGSKEKPLRRTFPRSCSSTWAWQSLKMYALGQHALQIARPVRPAPLPSSRIVLSERWGPVFTTAPAPITLVPCSMPQGHLSVKAAGFSMAHSAR